MALKGGVEKGAFKVLRRGHGRTPRRGSSHFNFFVEGGKIWCVIATFLPCWLSLLFQYCGGIAVPLRFTPGILSHGLKNWWFAAF